MPPRSAIAARRLSLAEAPESEVRARALDLLARREHARRELARKLASRGADPVVVESVLAALEREGLQCDQRFAEQLVHSRVGRGQGPVRVRRDLEERGVERAVIAQAIESSGVDWKALAMEVCMRRFPGPLPADPREEARRSRFLAGRGFTSEQAWAAVRQRDGD